MFIYKQYGQAELNRQFDVRSSVPEHAVHLTRREEWSRATENEFPSQKDIAYGEADRERLDIYPSAKPGSKTLVFIHGGYWQRLDKSDFQFVARAFHAYDITTVLITYPLAPAVSMDQIVASCRKAIHWVYQNISNYNGDASALYVAGHSAGGHLTAMMLATDWQQFNKDLPNDLVKGACVMSGLFNLVPIRLSEINDVLKMDEDMAARNSPVHLQSTINCPLIISVGGDESDEFRDQSKELYAIWRSRMPVEFLELDGVNHFSIVEILQDTSSPLHKAICGLMKLK